MIGWFRERFTREGNTQDEVEREKMAALDAAEKELASLRARSEKALNTLNRRDTSNHWRESIEQMIHGAM